jgi:LuxR family transcriptional activator of conjugal transfer of Ti plasmids
MLKDEMVFEDFADSLWTANDQAAFRNIVDRTAERLGFEWFAYLGIHETQNVWISNYPRDWISRYFEQEYERIDPVIVSARRQHRAFPWSVQGDDRTQPSLLQQFFGEAQEFGIRSGVTVPIRSGYEQTTALTFATNEPIHALECRLAESRDIVELIGIYLHARVDLSLAETHERQGPRLSQREVQCLTWAARGKTVAETAEITFLKARTVSFHLENSRNKLGASNVTQAVASAIKWGLIN